MDSLWTMHHRYTRVWSWNNMIFAFTWRDFINSYSFENRNMSVRRRTEGSHWDVGYLFDILFMDTASSIGLSVKLNWYEFCAHIERLYKIPIRLSTEICQLRIGHSGFPLDCQLSVGNLIHGQCIINWPECEVELIWFLRSRRESL